jgi:predicted transcriptional regulator
MPLSLLLTSLFESKTIPPTYKRAHIIYAILLLGKHEQGIGRYRIKNELTLGEGSTKTLLTRLKDEGIIAVEDKKQAGHMLTKKGKEILAEIRHYFSDPEPLSNPQNEFVVGKNAAYLFVWTANKGSYIQLGITQRDEAIKVGGSGATCSEFDGSKFVFPDKVPLEVPIPKEGLKKGDILVLGGGDSSNQAVLASLAAALSIVPLI